MTKKDAPQGTQAVIRAVRLLKIFSEAQSEKTLAELASATKLTKTTAHRLLAALESEGLVVRGTARNTYRLGPSIIALGVQALRSSDLRATARPFLSKLAEETGETATLEVLSDGKMLILDEISGRHLISAMVETGTKWPLHATSTGKALLAFLPEPQRGSLTQKPLAKFTPSTVTDWKELGREWVRIRHNGYATAVEELEMGFSAVGAVFYGPLGDVAGAVSVGGPTNRLTQKRLSRLGAQVKTAAEKISERLGYRGRPRKKSTRKKKRI
jgi:DNA-binding IclR family transcriptional regulator